MPTPNAELNHTIFQRRVVRLSWRALPIVATLALALWLLLAGDWLINSARPAWIPSYLWALLDIPVHSILGILVSWPLIREKTNGAFVRWLVVVILASTLIDIDHFIAAGSFSLRAALHLDYRPFSHSLVFGLACGLAAGALNRNLRLGTVVILCMTAHLLRDGAGGWTPYLFWPLKPVSYPSLVYITGIALVALAAWAVAAWLARRERRRPSST